MFHQHRFNLIFIIMVVVVISIRVLSDFDKHDDAEHNDMPHGGNDGYSGLAT